MATDSSFMQGYAALLSAAELVPFDCPSPFGPADRYQLDELAAITTKSWVYRATDQSFLADGKAPRVAVKISRSPGAELEGFLGRRVEHPGVVRVLEQGRTEEGHGYVVMEWVDGGDLSSTDLPWSARDAARLVLRLARIVQAAHRVLVVHCDLKPSNVLLTHDLEPRLADFDLAQRVSDDSQSRKGTLAYMAPEQFRGGPGSQSVQADVYALGGILHVLLKSLPPHGDDEETIKAALRSGTWAECAGVEPSLCAIMRKALRPTLNSGT
ncbi:MAG: serine/threonine-protein kinase [Phycisphaerales bacterium]